jgi:hypothetical protein
MVGFRACLPEFLSLHANHMDSYAERSGATGPESEVIRMGRVWGMQERYPVALEMCWDAMSIEGTVLPHYPWSSSFLEIESISYS